ncbi:MAG: hypothetical protein AAGK21_13260 [Bacteroidota bacterium]
MSEFHRLDATEDARFLRAGVADPLTKTPFRPTNEVVLCDTCGQVLLRETWEALGGCPDGDAPAPWTVEAALAAGDGARTRPPTPTPAAAPVPPPAPPERTRSWPMILLVALGVAALVVGGLFLSGALTGDDDSEEEVVVPTGPNSPDAVAIAEAGLVEGSLDESDFIDGENRYRDLYTFAADSSGRVLSFTVTSEDFFPDLVVETPEGDRVEAETVDRNDDTGSRTVRVDGLRGPGLYRVLLSSRQPQETGAYSLRLIQQDPIRPLRAGASAVQAELGAFSESADGFFRDRYQFSGPANREHTITVRSSAFAPVVSVRGPSGDVRGESGRAGGVITFVFTPSRSGTHTVLVSSQSRNQRGAYSIQLAVEPPPEVERPPEPTRLPTDGTAVTDSLAAGDTQTYRLQGRVGDRVRLEVRTDGFTPSLTLVAPDGTRTPATPDGDRARLRLTLSEGGAYRVLVGAADGGGEVRVSLEQEAAVTADDIPRLPGADLPSDTTPPEEEEGADGEDYQPQRIGDGPPPPEAP